MLEIIKEIKEILAIIVPLIAGIIFLIIKSSKNYKLRISAESIIALDKVISEFMCKAEEFINFTGNDKKEWVKTKVNQYCIQNKINFNESDIDALIEYYIQLSKKVNIREKDMLL